MALLPPYLTHLVVRWIHVLGMAALLGGAALVWMSLRSGAGPGTADETPTASLRVAASYEWLFWAGAGLLVLTGVGNLGALAPAIPDPATNWGASFAVKLAGVIVLLAGSVVRTVGVLVLIARAPTRLGPSTVDRVRAGYAATAVLLVVVVALAEVLAHG